MFRKRTNSKHEILNKSEGLKMKNPKQKQFDLEDRTFEFAKNVRAYIKRLPQNLSNREDVKQLLRSSGSVGANYIEANNSLGKKDFFMRIKISKKEAMESRYWLRLLDAGEAEDLESQRTQLIKEAQELTNIFGAILKKSTKS
jgi:four helix bundle protein